MRVICKSQLKKQIGRLANMKVEEIQNALGVTLGFQAQNEGVIA